MNGGEQLNYNTTSKDFQSLYIPFHDDRRATWHYRSFKTILAALH